MSLWWWWSDSLRWLEINLIGGSETIDHLIRMLIEFARAQGLLLNHWKMASYVKCWFLRTWNHASRWQNLIELKKSAASNLGEQFKRALNIFLFLCLSLLLFYTAIITNFWSFFSFFHVRLGRLKPFHIGL